MPRMPKTLLWTAIWMVGCNGSSPTVDAPPMPAPTITSVSPSSAVAGAGAIMLTVTGGNFISSSAIQWNGNNHQTTFVDSNHLTTQITSADLALPQDAAISVTTLPPGQGTSAEIAFPVTDPSPSITSLSPASANAGDPAFTLTITGTNFVEGSSIQWNGSYGQPPIVTSFVSSTQLTAMIPASDIQFAGSASVTVIDPSPGGGTSAPSTFTITGAIPSNTKFVAPDGNDADPGSISQPYLTIQKCATTASSGTTCVIRAGTYRETVTPNSGISIVSYDGEMVTIDGSDPVAGWSPYQGSIYKATVSLDNADTNQIFVNGEMMTEARWPNGDDPFHVNWAKAGAGTTSSTLVDSTLPAGDWSGAKIHFLSGQDPYSPETATVTGSGSGQLAFTLDDADNPPNIQPAPDGLYYLYRSLRALDTEREWFYDPSTSTLYLWPPGNADPGAADVRAKRRQYAIDLSGRSNVTISHIFLFASTINMDSSSTSNTLDSISAKYASHFTDLPSQSKLQPGAGAYGWLDYNWNTGIIINGTGNVLQNSTVAWSAGNGVTVAGSNNTVDNNLIVDTGYIGNDATGINLFGTGHHVDYNTVHTSGRYAVTINSYPVNPNNDDIGYNNMFQAMMLGRDGGEFYTGESIVTSTRVHHNWLHRTQALFSGAADNFTLNGVYLDEEASGFEVDQNVMWNNETYNVFLHGSSFNVTTPMNDHIHNNTVPDVGMNANLSLQNVLSCGTTQIVDNLVLQPVLQTGGSTCSSSNNGPAAPGATEMTGAVRVGCNFTGCASDPPPVTSAGSVAASIAAEPYDVTVAAGQPATFTVTGAGSPPLTYQWQRNGADITGATSQVYTVAATASADDGAIFTVVVSNSLGAVTSSPATLAVE